MNGGSVFSFLEGSWIRIPSPAMILGQILNWRRKILKFPKDVSSGWASPRLYKQAFSWWKGTEKRESHQTYDLISGYEIEIFWEKETYDLIGRNRWNYHHSDRGYFEQGLDKEDLTKLLQFIYGCKQCFVLINIICLACFFLIHVQSHMNLSL